MNKLYKELTKLKVENQQDSKTAINNFKDLGQTKKEETITPL